MDDEKARVAIAGLFQVVAIVVGFIALGLVMKFNGYPDETVVRWNPWARGLREHGVWLLLVPVAWILVTIMIWNYAKLELAFDLAIGFSYLFAIVILILFFWAAINSYRRPLLLQLKRTASAVERPESHSRIAAPATMPAPPIAVPPSCS